MNIEDLAKYLAPELNFLLTEPPFNTPSGPDYGWFCREHAFGVLVIGKLCGLQCKIVRGDFLIYFSHGDYYTSIGTDTDHAWCRTSTTPVLDFSLHCHMFQRAGRVPDLAFPITRLGQNGGFSVCLLPVSTNTNDYDLPVPTIGYIERTVYDWTALDLIQNPSLLLTTKVSERICLAVSLHGFRVIQRLIPPLKGTMNQSGAVGSICRTYANPVKELKRLLS